MSKVSLRMSVGAVLLAAFANAALAAPVVERSMIWSLQYETSAAAQSLVTTQASVSRSFDSAIGQALNGRANLATGEVGTRVESVANRSGQSTITMFDTLAFAPSGGFAATVSYSAHFEGSLLNPGADTFAAPYAQYRVSIYDITGLNQWIESDSVFGLFDTYAAVDDATLLSEVNIFLRTPLGGRNVTETGSFLAVPGRTYGIVIGSNSFANRGSVSDFLGTGTFRFTDLAGGSFESGSGVFLSAVPNAVSEPAHLTGGALLGLAVLAWLKRVRRRVD